MNNITVVLIRPQNSANLGFISRLLGNFDVSKLILIDPYVDLSDEETQKTAKHSVEILNNAEQFEYGYFKKLKREFDLVIGTTSVLGADYNIPRTPLTPTEYSDKFDSNQKVALVFGNEGTGLSNDEIKLCDFLVTIPTSKKYSALNISHAVSIILYELYKKHGENIVNSHIKKAENITSTFERANTGLVVINGKLIEKPVLREMYRILSIAKRIQ